VKVSQFLSVKPRCGGIFYNFCTQEEKIFDSSEFVIYEPSELVIGHDIVNSPRI